MNENSTKKGIAFEDKVFKILESKLSKDELFVPGKRSIIHKHKKYYSKDRDDNIIVDISIETFLPDAQNYSFLTVFECKDYKNDVPINDLEEFSSKLSQIAAHNAKGVIVTSSHFSKTGLNYAKSKGIAVIRLIENDDFEHLVYRKERFGSHQIHENIENILCDSSDIQPSKPIYILDKYSFTSLDSYLINLKIIDKPEKVIEPKIPYMTVEQIQKKVEEFFSLDITGITPTPLDVICKNLKKQFRVSFHYDKCLGDDDGRDILGKITFNPLCIYISSKLNHDEHRQRFTLAHEIAHLILHTELLSNIYFEGIDTDVSVFSDNELTSGYEKRIEIQANIFASILLMPQSEFKATAKQVFDIYRVNRGRLYLDNQPCNQEMFHKVASMIGNKFNVSKEAVKYRLISLNMLEGTGATSIRDVLSTTAFDSKKIVSL